MNFAGLARRVSDIQDQTARLNVSDISVEFKDTVWNKTKQLLDDLSNRRDETPSLLSTPQPRDFGFALASIQAQMQHTAAKHNLALEALSERFDYLHDSSMISKIKMALHEDGKLRVCCCFSTFPFVLETLLTLELIAGEDSETHLRAVAQRQDRPVQPFETCRRGDAASESRSFDSWKTVVECDRKLQRCFKTCILPIIHRGLCSFASSSFIIYICATQIDDTISSLLSSGKLQLYTKFFSEVLVSGSANDDVSSAREDMATFPSFHENPSAMWYSSLLDRCNDKWGATFCQWKERARHLVNSLRSEALEIGDSRSLSFRVYRAMTLMNQSVDKLAGAAVRARSEKAAIKSSQSAQSGGPKQRKGMFRYPSSASDCDIAWVLYLMLNFARGAFCVTWKGNQYAAALREITRQMEATTENPGVDSGLITFLLRLHM